MKILVFSDSHGAPSYIRAAMKAHRDADAAVFLGDGAADAASVFADFPAVPHCILRGNCDSALALRAHGLDAEEEVVLNFGGVRFLCLHGHTRGAKSGYGRMILRAAEVEADAVLFGHTHMPENDYTHSPADPSRRILLFNPGSVGLSYNHTYGVINIVGGMISAGHGRADV